MHRGLRATLALVLLAAVVPSLSARAALRGQQGDANARYEEILAFAVGSDGEPGDLDRFWRDLFGRLEGSPKYESPGQLLAYDAEHPPASDCYRGPEEAPPPNGAFYCPADQTLGWHDPWLRGLHKIEGFEFAPLAVIAHEWGHHVQSLLGRPDADLAAELQADCYASLYLNDANDRGELTVEEFLFGLIQLYLLGNLGFTESQWFDPREHGTPALRSMAVSAGSATSLLNTMLEMNDSTNWGADLGYCSDYGAEDFEQAHAVKVGPFAVNELPNSEVHVNEDGSIDLIHPVATTRIEFHPGLILAPTAFHFTRARDAYLGADPKAVPHLIGEPQELQLSNGRSALVQSYELTRPRADKTTVTHGIIVLDIVPDVGGILFDLSHEGTAPADGDAWNPFLAHLVALSSATCFPDEAAFNSCLFSDLSQMGLPEVTVSSSKDGIELDHWVVDPGPTLFSFTNEEMVDFRLDGTEPVATAFVLVRLSDVLDLDPTGVPAEFPSGRQAATPDWFYDATLLGGPFTSGTFVQAQAIVDLTPGEWVVVGYPFITPISPSFTVRDAAEGTASVEPEDARPVEPVLDADIVLDDGGMSGFEEIGPGHQTWRVTNHGEEPHDVLMYRFPDGTTSEQIVTWAEYFSSPAGTAPPADLGFDPDTDVDPEGLTLAAISGGQSVLVELTNLLPGTYAAFCSVPDQNAETVHWERGEVAVFTVGRGFRFNRGSDASTRVIP